MERQPPSPLCEVCSYLALQMGSALSKTQHLENQRSSRVRGKPEGQAHLSVHLSSAPYQLGGLGALPLPPRDSAPPDPRVWMRWDLIFLGPQWVSLETGLIYTANIYGHIMGQLI